MCTQRASLQPIQSISYAWLVSADPAGNPAEVMGTWNLDSEVYSETTILPKETHYELSPQLGMRTYTYNPNPWEAEAG